MRPTTTLGTLISQHSILVRLKEDRGASSDIVTATTGFWWKDNSNPSEIIIMIMVSSDLMKFLSSSHECNLHDFKYEVKLGRKHRWQEVFFDRAVSFKEALNHTLLDNFVGITPLSDPYSGLILLLNGQTFSTERTTGSQNLLFEERIDSQEKVFVVTSAFGIASPTVFMNAVYPTTIAMCVPSWGKVEGENGLFGISMPWIWNLEGSPVFNERGCLVGIVLPQLQLSSGMHLEIPLVLSTKMLLDDELIRNLVPGLAVVRSPAPSSILAVERFPSIVLVQMNGIWASAFFFHNSNFVMTCGHVFYDLDGSKRDCTSLTLRIPSSCGKDEYVKGILVYLARHNSPIDVALIQVMWQEFHPFSGSRERIVCFSSRGPQSISLEVGNAVRCVGFPLIYPSENTKLKPIITSGHITNVVFWEDSPVMILTSALVYNGQSGGVLLDDQNNFLGIIVNNIRFKDKEYPQVNCSLPANVLKGLEDQICQRDNSSGPFLDLNSSDVFEKFENSALVHRIWQFCDDDELGHITPALEKSRL